MTTLSVCTSIQFNESVRPPTTASTTAATSSQSVQSSLSSTTTPRSVSPKAVKSTALYKQQSTAIKSFEGPCKTPNIVNASTSIPDRLKGFNATADIWATVAAADSFAIKKRVLSRPLSFGCCCCFVPSAGSLPTSYTVLAGQGGQDRLTTLFRADETESIGCYCCKYSTSHSRCLCIDYFLQWLASCGCTDHQLEIRKYIPLPGDAGHRDFSHLTDDTRIKMESFLTRKKSARSVSSTESSDSTENVSSHSSSSTSAKLGKLHETLNMNREIAVRKFYQKNPVLFAVRRQSSCFKSLMTCLSWIMCCTYNCSCLNYFPCFNCIPCGAISVHALKTISNMSSKQPVVTETALIGQTDSPWSSIFSCCALSTVLCCQVPHVDMRDEFVDVNSKASRFAQLVSICFHGGWDKRTGHTYNFPMSFPESKFQKGDFGVVTKMKTNLLDDNMNCRMKFNEANMSQITSEHKMTALGTQLMLI
jgi:hypothetical protein